MSQPHPRKKSYTHRKAMATQGGAAQRTSETAAPRAPYYAGYQQVSGKKQLEEAIDLLFRRRWIIVAAFLLITGGTVLYTMRQVPQYSASSVVMVDLGTQTTPQVNIPGGENSLFANNGRTMAGELFIIQNSFAIEQRVRQRLAEEAAGVQGFATFGAASREVSAMRITATSPSPSDAALLANIYAEEYVRLTQEASRSYMTASREYLEEQEQMRRAELQAAEERLTRHLASGKGLALDPTGSAVVEKLSGLEAQRDQALINLKMRTTQLDVLENELGEMSPQLARRIASDLDQRIAAARQRLAAAEAERKNALVNYAGLTEEEISQRSPQFVEVNRQIAQLRSEILQLSEQYAEEVLATGGVLGGEEGLSVVADLKRQAVQSEIEIDGLKAQIDVLNRHIGQSEYELSAIPAQSLELARLQREKQHAEQMYGYVVQKLQETRISEVSEPGYAHILREAAPPSEPVYPDKPRNIILGLFFGLLAGLGLAIIRDKFDNRLYKPDDLTSRGYTVVGTIPDMTALIKEDHKGAEFVEQGDRKYATSLVSLVNPISTVAETYRQLRTRIQFSRPDVVVQTILVTSSSPGEGKTVSASNLAVTMAQAGRRTLLLDADLRRPRVHEVWGLQPRVGLVQMLFSQPGVSIESFRSGVDNLYVVPAGSFGLAEDAATGKPAGKLGPEAESAVISNPGELLGSKRMRDLLEQMREQFDVIVIDTPPVLAASDAVLLSTQADASIVVVRAGKTKEGEVEAVVEEMESVGATIIGLLLNGFDVSMAYGRKYRYQHYSKYGPYAKYGYYTARPKA